MSESAKIFISSAADPMDSFWSEDNVRRFKDDILRDIMETEPALFRDFAIKLIGGVKQ
ncbi:hypothetical protein EV207_11652 [Scopulibacillus darangshiensis]|uniref:Uncharacterized protein n=1 Tax=Scopulibacillus darangshiensis TaxID=442528 RepID=A0A4R2P232_9BACL|nr:hypothetical protein [Scopulibacillus darangshiensis]TCP28740.1 hypothetical protein EV207_11652 [Scopulibacillus darangshiensis]